MVGEFLISVMLGLIVLALLYITIDETIFSDWTAFLPVIISTAMFSLYVATYRLRSLFPEMDARLHPKKSDVYLVPLNKYLSNKHFILAGIAFGSTNCLMGYAYGLPYQGDTVISIAIMASYFIVGFVCGMAAYSIFAVSLSINVFTKEASHSLDYTSPDNCGGTKIFGDALLVFGGVTLVVGVMISVYIIKAGWLYDENWWRVSLKMFWIIFPYLMSITVLIVPSSVINAVLRKYKLEQEVILKVRLAKINEQLAQTNVAPERLKELRDDYKFIKSSRETLYEMRTWPIDIGANYKFLTILIGNATVSGKVSYSWLDELGLFK